MQSKPRIMWLSDGPGITTGFATITRKAMNILADKGWDCHYLSHTGNHQTYLPGVTLEDGEVFKFTTYGSGQQPYCQDILMPRIRELKPNVFGVLLDTFMCYPWMLNIDFSPAKSFFYFPSDGGTATLTDKPISYTAGLPLDCWKILKKVDYPIAMSMFAQRQAKEIHNIDTDYIPHAVEEDIYKPLTEQERYNLKLKWGIQDKFVIGVVARAQPRKMLDRTLFVMKKVAKEIPNAVLLLHCDRYDPANYFNFDVLINQLQLNNRVFFTGTTYHRGFNYKQMNEIYNLMDVFFLGTSGEGFGIPLIEAMACEIPVITTNYTTGPEIVERNNAGELVDVKEEIFGSWHVPRAIIDVEDSANKIIKLYKDEQLRKYYGKNGRQAVLRDYTWNDVGEKWNQTLKKLL